MCSGAAPSAQAAHVSRRIATACEKPTALRLRFQATLDFHVKSALLQHCAHLASVQASCQVQSKSRARLVHARLRLRERESATAAIAASAAGKFGRLRWHTRAHARNVAGRAPAAARRRSSLLPTRLPAAFSRSVSLLVLPSTASSLVADELVSGAGEGVVALLACWPRRRT